MKRIHRSDKRIDKEIGFSWFTNKFNSYEPFEKFALGQNPKDVAEEFIDDNITKIYEMFEKFDDEDKDALEQLQKLTECEWHVFSILKNQLEFKQKVKFVDFKKK